MGFYDPQTTYEEWLMSRPAHERRSRRMRVAERKGTHTAEQWTALQLAFGLQCVRCGETKPLTKDHVEAVSRGGCNCIANIQPLCESCNCSKCARDGDFREDANPLWANDYQDFLKILREHAG